MKKPPKQLRLVRPADAFARYLRRVCAGVGVVPPRAASTAAVKA
ncbi:hypothetical protein [Hymenobacter tenuis]